MIWFPVCHGIRKSSVFLGVSVLIGLHEDPRDLGAVPQHGWRGGWHCSSVRHLWHTAPRRGFQVLCWGNEDPAIPETLGPWVPSLSKAVYLSNPGTQPWIDLLICPHCFPMFKLFPVLRNTSLFSVLDPISLDSGPISSKSLSFSKRQAQSLANFGYQPGAGEKMAYRKYRGPGFFLEQREGQNAGRILAKVFN